MPVGLPKHILLKLCAKGGAVGSLPGDCCHLCRLIYAAGYALRPAQTTTHRILRSLGTEETFGP